MYLKPMHPLPFCCSVSAVASLLFLYLAPVPAAQATQSAPWLPPIPGALRVGDGFAPPQFNWNSGHRGVDLCPPVGTNVCSPTAGTVIYAGQLNDRQLVSIQLANGWKQSFEPLTSLAVKPGQTVSAGQLLGQLAPGHTAHGNPQQVNNCLHWGVRNTAGTYLNPLQFLFEKPRLLPWVE